MAKGAIEMEKSQGKFQAATGRSREEAIEFSKAMNGIVGTAKTVGASFEEISDTGIAVSQQFDITGQKATDLTEDILGFAKVTGQDASDAALQLEDTLSAFGLSADDAAGFMDQLVASSQKFGTDAGPATLGILQGMAPALQAMGEDLDAGVGLLNLFETAGLDAAKAPAALNKAIATLKPGQSLDDLITQISSIEDPTLRAQEAMKIFGARSGVGLANAMQPGIDSLDDFIPTIEEAAGASDRAAEDMLTTSDKIRMFTEKAGSYLRGLGQDFGPVVTGLASIASLGAPFAKGIVGLFKGLLTSAPIKAAAGAAGAAASAAYSAGMKMVDAITGLMSSAWTAIKNSGPAKVIIGAAGAAAAGAYSIGMKVAEVVGGAVEAVWVAIGRPGSSMLTAAGASGITAGSAFSSGVLIGLATLGVAAAAIFGQKFYDEVLKPGMGTNGPQAFDAALAQQMSAAATNAGTAAGEAAAEAIVPSFENGLMQGPPLPPGWSERLSLAAGDAGDDAGTAVVNHWTMGQQRQLLADRAATSAAFAESVREAMLEAHRIAAWGGAQTPGEFSQGLRSAFDTVRTAFTDLKDLMKNTLSPVQKEVELIGIATSKRLAKALEDGRPEVRGEAQQIALDTIAELYALNPASTKIGDLTTKLLAAALPNERPALQDAIDKIVATVTGPLGTLPGIAETAGERIGGALAQGLRNKFGSVTTAAENLAGIIRGRLELDSPAKAGPWSKDGGPFAWMLHAGKGMAENLQKGLNSGGLVMPPALAGMAGFGSFPGIHTQGMGAQGRSVTVGDITVNVYGVDGDPEEIGSKAAAAFAWNLEHAMSAVTSG